MRIALIHMRHAHSGGTERYLNLLSAHLAEHGHQVTVVCRTHEEASHASIEFVVLKQATLGSASRMWRFAKAVEKYIAGANFDVVFGLGRTWSHDVVRLGGGCHQTYFDLAHEATQSPIEKLFRKGHLKHKWALEVERRAFAPHPDRIGGGRPVIIANSDLVQRDVIERYGVSEADTRVIYNGVDTERFHPRLGATKGAELRDSLGWSSDEKVLLFLGTGYGRKGLDLVLDATARLAKADDALRLLVVGYDSSKSAYEARAAELGLAGRCVFLGGRRDAEVCFAAADVYALPTRYDPFANSTLEAMASGLPTITTPTNGGSVMVEDGKGGSVLSAQPGADELADRIQYWFEHREAGARHAREVAEANDARFMVQKTRTLLEQLAQRKV